jgi:hypothetical protein
MIRQFEYWSLSAVTTLLPRDTCLKKNVGGYYTEL